MKMMSNSSEKFFCYQRICCLERFFVCFRAEQQVEELLNDLTASIEETVKRQKMEVDSVSVSC